MDTSSPYTPVMMSGEQLSYDVKSLALQHLIVMLKALKVIILCTHGTVEYLKARIELFLILE